MAGRRPPPPTVVVHDLPMRERLDRLERAMALLGEECPPRHAGRAMRSSPLYAEWADLKARFAAIIDPDKPFDSESPGDWDRVFQRFRRWRAKLPRIPTTRRDNAELFGYERDGSWSERPFFAIGSTFSRASGNRSSEPFPFRGGAPRALRFGRNG